MIEQYLSTPDTIILAVICGIAIKFIQFFYFDKQNGGKK